MIDRYEATTTVLSNQSGLIVTHFDALPMPISVIEELRRHFAYKLRYRYYKNMMIEQLKQMISMDFGSTYCTYIEVDKSGLSDRLISQLSARWFGDVLVREGLLRIASRRDAWVLERLHKRYKKYFFLNLFGDVGPLIGSYLEAYADPNHVVRFT